MVDFDKLVNRGLIGVLGEPVSYQVSGVAYNINAVFADESTFVDAGSGEILTSAPTLLVRKADVPAEVSRGDKVRLRGRDYTVYDAKQDGEGGVELELKLNG